MLSQKGGPKVVRIDPDGLAQKLEDQAAEFSEQGYFQMLHCLPSEEGEWLVRGIACRFWAANGNELVRMRIGQAIYLLHIDALEKALLDPAPREGPIITLEAWPSREWWHETQGALVISRFVLEVKEEDLLEPLPAMITAATDDHYEMQLDSERFIFDPEDLWNALTDPATFRPGDDGPSPIDVLRHPIES